MVEYGYQHLEGKRVILHPYAADHYVACINEGVPVTNFNEHKYLSILRDHKGKSLLVTHETKETVTLKLSRNLWIGHLKVTEINVDKSLVEAVK